MDFMLWIGMPQDKIQKHTSQYLSSLIHDPGELFDNQTRLIYADLHPSQLNIVYKCRDIYEVLKEQMDDGEIADRKLQILKSLSSNLQKFNPKRLDSAEFNLKNDFVRKNRSYLNCMTVHFKTFDKSMETLCQSLSLSIAQRKALIDCCDFTKNVQTFKIGYLVDRVGLNDIKIYRLMQYVDNTDLE